MALEDQQALPAWSELQLDDAFGEPLADLLGLGDGAPHDVDWSVDFDLTRDLVVRHVLESSVVDIGGTFR